MPSTNLQQYTLLFVSAAGPILTQEQDITIRRMSNGQPVSTVVLGYAGDSPGAAMCEIDVTNAIPSLGFEFDPSVPIQSLTPIPLYVYGPGGKILKTTAIIFEDTTSHGVNKQAQISFKARAAFQPWE